MTHKTFRTFSKLLIGEWVGYRHSGVLEHEEVRSQWQIALDGSFLLEHWHTAGSKDSPEPTADAFFRISDSGPGDFIAVYKSGKIAFGESTFKDSEWTLTHRWLRESGIATIRIRFLDSNSYEQEVAEVASDGTLIPESFVVMKRNRTIP
jgi:hypothetical protein